MAHSSVHNFTTLFFVCAAYDVGSIFVPELVKQFAWRRAQIGLLFTAFGVLNTIGAPLGGWLLDRMDARMVVSAGAAIAAIGLTITSQADRFTPMLIGFATYGIGIGACTYVPLTVVISNWFNADSGRGLAMGIAMSGENLGAMVMTLVVSTVMSVGGWRVGYLVLASPIVFIVIPLIFAVVRTRPSTVNLRERDRADQLTGMEFRDALRVRSLWIIAFAEFCLGFYLTAVLVHLAAYLTGIGYSSRSAAFALSALLGLGVLGQPLIGIMSDRTTPRMAVSLAFLLNVLGFILTLRARSSVLYLLPLILFFGLTFTSPLTLLSMVLANCFGLRRFGSLSGMMGVFYNCGVSAGPLVAGYIFDTSASYSRAFELCAVLSILSASAIWLTVPLADKSCGLEMSVSA